MARGEGRETAGMVGGQREDGSSNEEPSARTRPSPLTTRPSPIDWLDDESARFRAEGLWRSRRTVTSLPDGWCDVEGRRVLNFAANDYLNLAQDRRVIAAARDAMSASGATASALVAGRSPWHVRLEQRLAEFEGQEAAVLFPTGYAANVGTLSALLGQEDLVFCDRFNHASLIDGCRMSGAKLRVYRHDDLDGLRRALHSAGSARRRAIVTDSVFSMDGDVAPLPELCDLADEFGAMLIVDEAHATGVFGANGRGVAEEQGVENPGMVRIGTLSKALGTLGGFVTGPQSLCDWLWNTARTQMFSTALPPAVCAAAVAALDIVASEPWRRVELRDRSGWLESELTRRGMNVPPNVRGPIIPVLVGDAGTCVAASQRLLEQGILVPAIRPPTVPQGTSRLRISLSVAHSEGDVRGLADALSRELSHVDGSDAQS